MIAAIVVLAVFRITWLFTHDEFPPILSLRGDVAAKWGPDSWQAYLSTCPWCLSFWVGLAVLPLLLITGADVPLPVAFPFVTSATTGIIATIITALD